MNRSILILFAALVAHPLFAVESVIRSIFDGSTLKGWEGDPQSWRVEEGAITGEIAEGQRLAHNKFLFWESEVADFELNLEFRLTGAPSANSGIQYRCVKRADGEPVGYQADLDNGDTWLGLIYEENGRALIAQRGTRVAIAPDGRRWVDTFAQPDEFKSLFKAGEWNHYRITATASHVEIRVNGKLTSVLDDRQSNVAKFSGRIALQLHSGDGPAKIQFRNIRVTDLGRTVLPAANAVPASLVETAKTMPPVDQQGRLINLGFETGTFEGWKVEGKAWGTQPTHIAADAPANPRSPVGSYWLGRSEQADKGTGQLTSPTFKITQRWGGFLSDGDHDINLTRIEIIDAETNKVIVTRAAGEGYDNLQRKVIDFEQVMGRSVFIRLIDESKWSHLEFDDFVFFDREPDANLEKNRDFLHQQNSAVLWHLQPNPAKPTPVANPVAQKIVKEMLVTDGFQADLVAAEPNVHQPIAMTFDEKGRLWVVEAYCYPQKQPAGQGKDRIIILEDKDGDGFFEAQKVFAENLNLVSGIAVGFGGVWVGAAPELLFIADRNHDDKPDSAPEVLLDGWDFTDTHETLNSFTWGPDGWLYGNQGVFVKSLVGKPGTAADKRQLMTAGVWRYHPIRHEFEIFARGGSNQWGLDFNDRGDFFMAHCRSFFGGGGTTYVIRNGHYWNQANSGYAPFIVNHGPDFAPEIKNYLPASARYDTGEGGAGKPGTDAVYGGHAHAGTMVYLGDNWPDIYRNQVLTHNLFGRQLNRQHNERDGAGYETFDAGYDLMYAPDQTFLGVGLAYGPDGAAYMTDWSDLQHCHNPREEIWERSTGRIYRLSWTETWRPVKVDLGARTDTELAALHTHKNEWFVRTARRLLQERAAARSLDQSALGTLRVQAADATNHVGQLRAFWTLHVTGALQAADYVAAAASPFDGMRAWAVHFATERPMSSLLSPEILRRMATEDPSATVRLALASALPAIDPATAWAVGAALAGHAEDAADRFLPKVIWSGIAPHVATDLNRALDLSDHTVQPAVRDSLIWFVAQTAQGRDLLAQRLVRLSSDTAARVVRLMVASLENEATLPLPPAWPEAVRRLAGTELPVEGQAAVENLSALFGDEAVLNRNKLVLADAKAPLADRQTALNLLKRANDTSATSLYVRLLDEENFRSAVLPLLAKSSDADVAPALIAHYAVLGEADQRTVLEILTSRPINAVVLLNAVRGGQLDRKNLTALHLRQLRALRDPKIDQMLIEVWGKPADVSADNLATINRLRKKYESAPAWSYSGRSGRAVFGRACISCHTIDGAGGKLGPNLTGSWRNGLDYFLENIVDPNAIVGVDYQLNVVTRKDASIAAGIVESETPTVLVIRTIAEAISIPKDQIKSREITTQSMMPPGLLESLPESEAMELLKFLTQPR